MAGFHLVFSCAVCRKIRDDQWDGAIEQAWCSMVEFFRRHQTRADNVSLSECYCPDCAQSYDRLVRYGQTRQDTGDRLGGE
jgi:hypothetical protein